MRRPFKAHFLSVLKRCLRQFGSSQRTGNVSKNEPMSELDWQPIAIDRRRRYVGLSSTDAGGDPAEGSHPGLPGLDAFGLFRRSIL